jgi:2-iminobutanoate/2-iminopropanoate deaminase
MKQEVTLKNINDFSTINSIYAQQFKDYPPARETVEVSALPKNANIEISVIAVR